MKITRLFVYPVKGLRGIELQKSRLFTEGLPHDREWMLVDVKGNFVTQRQLPSMATIGTNISADSLVLSHPSAGSISIPLVLDESKSVRTVSVWGNQVSAIDEGGHVSDWLTEALGLFRKHQLKLVRFDKRDRRLIKDKYLFDGEEANTYFADGFPYLITSLVSLHALNLQLKARGFSEVSIERFRPNVVIDNCESAFHELFYQNCSEVNGQYQLSIRKACERCPVTTIDQETGERREPTQPLGVLRELNPLENHPGAFFGGNAILTKGIGSTIMVGDQLMNE
ncbi:MOSC domain-containing protein [Agaribacter marinus]|uniref:Fe-S protein n=1 Tax=Agaribacter marinus TaxID=1431249 RepID=A0AA37SXF6_9ALTE|nr:MOSC N-terminal beta barrel domain-containing protein [Agaribacter marinus]GLR70304.1 Fe-S protein [Agaribacter marinus]